jgi:tetratricopeptide (TPR) repeat protein
MTGTEKRRLDFESHAAAEAASADPGRGRLLSLGGSASLPHASGGHMPESEPTPVARPPKDPASRDRGSFGGDEAGAGNASGRLGGAAFGVAGRSLMLRGRVLTLRRSLARFALVLTTLAVLVSPATARRVVVLAIDGIDPDVVALLAGEGKLPSFTKLKERGAFGRLLSSKPILSPIIWTTIATGKSPSEHGIGHFTATAKDGKRLPVTSRMRHVPAIWNIVSDAGREVAVVGWWATWPAEKVKGTIVSDHVGYHFLFEDGVLGTEEKAGAVHPPEKEEAIVAKMRRPGSLHADEVAPFVTVDEAALSRPFDFDDDLGHFKWAFATADSYRRIGLDLLREDHPDLLMVYIEGVDSTSHLFGHLFRARGLVGELAEQQKRYGKTVEEMYRFADRIVGEYLDAIDDDTTLVVLSDHGFQLGALHEDPSKTRDMRRVSERYHRIEGILYLYGSGIRPGTTIEGAKLVDVAPTLLSLLGLSPAKDMPGRTLGEALDFSHPERTVASYGKRDAVADDAPDQADAAILARLEALGYVEKTSPQNDRNLANIAFSEGRYVEAEQAYRKLIAANPKDATLHSSLAGALGALGRYDEALTEIDVAIQLEPINPEPYHNRAVVLEKQGKRDEAIHQYREALRYQPAYEPSREALRRLGAQVHEGEPATPERRRATELAEQAGVAARRGDYPTAHRLLDEAEAADPRFTRILQYRANVAYIQGDRDRAIAALTRALEIEPDNALFRSNLESLRARPGGTAAGAPQPSPIP